MKFLLLFFSSLALANTPNMNLTIPTVGVTTGPTYATDINNALTTIDSHDHSPGNGVAISNAGISTTAAIARSKLATDGASTVVVNNNSGALSYEPVLPVSLGGTDLPSYATGDMLYAAGPSSLARLAASTNGFTLKLSGGLPTWSANTQSLVVQSKTAPYTIQSTDSVVLGDSSGGTFQLTLPTCSTYVGTLYIKKIDSSITAITIARSGGDTIQDSSSAVTSTTLNTQGEEVLLVSNGSSVWQVMNRRIDSTAKTDLSFTPNSVGTISNSFYMYQRVGSNMVANILWKNGTPGAAAMSVSLPSNIAIDSTKLSSSTNATRLGTWTIARNSTTQNVSSQDNEGPVFYDGSDTAKIYFALTTGASAGQLTKTLATGLFSASDVISVQFTIPVSGWNG